ncbi:MAG: hypothetical protein ACK5MK_07005 [Dysgonomonas sp.]
MKVTKENIAVFVSGSSTEEQKKYGKSTWIKVDPYNETEIINAITDNWYAYVKFENTENNERLLEWMKYFDAPGTHYNDPYLQKEICRLIVEDYEQVVWDKQIDLEFSPFTNNSVLYRKEFGGIVKGYRKVKFPYCNDVNPNDY